MRTILTLVVTSLLLFADTGFTAEEENPGVPPMQVRIVDPITDSLLGSVEEGDRQFKRMEVDELKRASYFHRRRIGDAVVEKDYIRYMFDTETGELVSESRHWRDDLPASVEPVISMEEAEDLVEEGTVLPEFTKLYFISPDSDVFKLETPTKNPCWVVRSKDELGMIITIIDAMTGEILGHGLPPPYEGLSIHGPDWGACPQSAIWYDHAENARSWFSTMGYSTERIGNASEVQVQGHLQSDSTSMFYELDHGGDTSFHNRCDQDITATEVETWIADHASMPFAFIGSCGGLCNTGDDTFSHEFRKGMTEDTVTLGYCNMDFAVCDDCWPDAIPWQTELFSRMNSGYTVGTAYAYANLAYPDCADDSHNCMRITGDTLLKFKGSGVSHVTRSKCGYLYNPPPYYLSPLPGVQNRNYSRAYHIRCNSSVPAGYFLTLSPSTSYPYLDMVFLNDALLTADGPVVANGSDGEITIRSATNRGNGMTFTGELKMQAGGQIKVFE